MKIGIVFAFTGHYRSVRFLARFLELLDMEVIKSQRTTPSIIEAGTTLTSADYCVPIRTYVGHVHELIKEHPDLDYIVAPRIISEDTITSTCSKYRDVGGVTIRSLVGQTAYNLKEARPAKQAKAKRKLTTISVNDSIKAGKMLPHFLQPAIRSADKESLFNVCFDLYADIYKLPKTTRLLRFFPKAKWVKDVQKACEEAYEEVFRTPPTRWKRFLEDTEKPRLAIVGRRYLVNDPALTADLKNYFLHQGVNVITAQDVPFEQYQHFYEEVDGYYDTHREGQAFIDWALPHVDGFITVGSFGCHPDAFQVDTLAEYARNKGSSVWSFRYDETSGQAGFATRYETILTFIEENRDYRLKGVKREMPKSSVQPLRRVSGKPGQNSSFIITEEKPKDKRKPLLIWPTLGEAVDLLIKETAHQAGLTEYIQVPPPLDEETVEIGHQYYPESCSPYAFSTGNLIKAINLALDNLEDNEPRRIVVLMARGEGPCTFGWYAISQNQLLPTLFKDRLEKEDHTLEMATMGLDGIGEFLQDLASLGDANKLSGIVTYVEAIEKGMDTLPYYQRQYLKLRLLYTIKKLTKPLWVKLEAIEKLRALSLKLRAHELERGSVTRAYREGLKLIDNVHTTRDIKKAYKEAHRLLKAIPVDKEEKPRVIVIGEIYVALTSFANRGTVENLMGKEGIEIEEAVTISAFIHHSLEEMKRRSRLNYPVIGPIVRYLNRYGFNLLGQKIREEKARPFIDQEVGGDGLPSVGKAREALEKGANGILHIYPFKCMPEGIARDALKELSQIYSVRYLSLSFDKETDIERLKTEIKTFATLLHSEQREEKPLKKLIRQYRLLKQRRDIGHLLDSIYYDGRKNWRIH